MEEELILFKNEDGVGTITINRPKALNALNLDMLKQLDGLLDKIKDDASVRVVILTGAGEKAFIAGADIAYMSKQTPLGVREFAATGQRISRKFESSAAAGDRGCQRVRAGGRHRVRHLLRLHPSGRDREIRTARGQDRRVPRVRRLAAAD